ncbi:MAG: hypothetical protein IPP40_17940 [bacterium]|nr:hypothetical protein [bacterium]
MKIVFGEAQHGTKISSSGLKAWAISPSGTSNAIRSFLNSWGTSMRVWFEQEKFELDDQESSAISHGLPTGAIIIAFATFVLLIMSEQPISLHICCRLRLPLRVGSSRLLWPSARSKARARCIAGKHFALFESRKCVGEDAADVG